MSYPPDKVIRPLNNWGLVDKQITLGQWQPQYSPCSQIDSPVGRVKGWLGYLLPRQNIFIFRVAIVQR